ncbi:unnamed protein product [marine sediment metagenome]|uniref:Uncharacterized protein n=1 Tax=marine sediment metagenome TaxID=412755 RepID=X1U660_9ZZZZ
MKKRIKGFCRECGEFKGEKCLSKQKLCHDCAAKRMLAAFNASWAAYHDD